MLLLLLLLLVAILRHGEARCPSIAAAMVGVADGRRHCWRRVLLVGVVVVCRHCVEMLCRRGEANRRYEKVEQIRAMMDSEEKPWWAVWLVELF